LEENKTQGELLQRPRRSTSNQNICYWGGGPVVILPRPESFLSNGSPR